MATRERPAQLARLLDALSAQRGVEGDLEVVVAHDSLTRETHLVATRHRLHAQGRLHVIDAGPAQRTAAAKRNLAWRRGRGDLVLFTDDDCRPNPDWVATAVAAAHRHPGRVIQGRTQPDPSELAAFAQARWSHTVHIDPPTAWAETCNIGYPRDILVRLGGFDEGLDVGEDTDLALRARNLGATLVPVPEMLVEHAVVERSLRQACRAARRWEQIPLVVRRHPSLRRALVGGLWWKPEHAVLTLAVAGLVLSRHSRASCALLAPWLAVSMRHTVHGHGPLGWLRRARDLPALALVDVTETVVILRGAWRYRAPML